MVSLTMKQSASQQGLYYNVTVKWRVCSKPLFTVFGVDVCCDVKENSRHIKASTVTWNGPMELRTYEPDDGRIGVRFLVSKKAFSLSQSIQNVLSGSYQNGTSAYFPKRWHTLVLTYPVTSVNDAFLLPLSSAQQLQRDVATDASFACD